LCERLAYSDHVIIFLKSYSWSWLVAAVGLVLVVGSAGFMLYQAFAGDSSPPELVIETDAVVPRAGAVTSSRFGFLNFLLVKSYRVKKIDCVFRARCNVH
jgi:hypothetical protein